MTAICKASSSFKYIIINRCRFTNKVEDSRLNDCESVAPKSQIEDRGNKSQTKPKSKKKHSEVRFLAQEQRLKENNLNYESRETYNDKTKRVSRVLVCLHENCGKEFTKTRNLIIHSRVHTKLKPHSCEFCGKSFTQKCNLKKHIELHENGKYIEKSLD